MMVKETFKAVIGLVGPSGGGKSTLGEYLKIYLQGAGFGVVGWNAGDVFRKMGGAIEKNTAAQSRLVTDREIDGKTLVELQKSIGLEKWNNIHPNSPGVVAIVSGRVVSLLAARGVAENIIPSDGYIGISVNAPIDARAERAYVKKIASGETTSIDIERERLERRDRDDLTAFEQLYDVKSSDQIYGVPPNELQLDSSKLSVDDELQQTIIALISFGLLT